MNDTLERDAAGLIRNSAEPLPDIDDKEQRPGEEETYPFGL